MSNQDRLLSDEELTNTLSATFFRLSGGMNNIATAEAEHLLDLINTQKRLYAESVIGIDSNPDPFDEDFPTQGMLEDIRLDAENKLRAEQRARVE